jgi:hypothetical protein
MLEEAINTNADRVKQKEEAKVTELIETVSNIGGGTSGKLPLSTDAVLTSALPLSPEIERLIAANDLGGALDMLMNSITNPTVKRLIQIILDNLGATNVVIVKNLRADDGRPAAGLFDPSNNTIFLDADAGMNIHTLLHELGHAVTSAQIADPKNATAKQVKTLFEGVKDKISTAYGSTNPDEFVAEYFGNSKFRQELARIKPDGSSVPALRIMANIVANMFRRMFGIDPKAPSGSAASQLDKLLQSLVSKAPNRREANQLLLESSTPEAVMKRVSEVVREGLGKRKDTGLVDGAASFLGTTVPEKVKKVFLRLMQLQGLREISERYGFGDLVARLNRAFDVMRQNMQKSDQNVRNTLIANNKLWKEMSLEQQEMFNTLIYNEEIGSTIQQVDPMLSRADAKKFYSKQPAKFKIWEEQQLLFNHKDGIGADGRKLYKDMSDYYKSMYNKLKDAIESRINDTEGTDATKKAAKDKIFGKLLAMGELQVYFPLVRQGNFLLEYQAKDGNLYIERFRSAGERRAAEAEIRDNPQVKQDSIFMRDGDLEKGSLGNIPATSFVADVIETLQANKVAEDVQVQILNMFVDSLPESSFAKSLRGRKGTPGYMKDAMYAFEIKAFSLGRQTERLNSTREILSIRDELNEKAAILRRSPANNVGKYKNKAIDTTAAAFRPSVEAISAELNRRVEFALNGADNKGIEKYVKGINQIGFLYTIGFNAASAAVNLSQVPMYVLPKLAGEYGWPAAIKEMTRAMALVSSTRHATKKESKIGKALDKISLANGLDNFYTITPEGEFSVRRDLDLSAERIAELTELGPLVKESYDRGYLQNAFLLDSMGVEENPSVNQNVVSKYYGLGMSLSSAMFNQAERFNRQTTLVMGYRLELARLKKEEPNLTKGQRQDRAVQGSILRAQQTNGGTVLETASGYSQEGFGRVALMYKNYGIQMYTDMFATAFTAIEQTLKGNKKEARIARRQVIGMLGSSVFFSGVYGIPIYGAVQMIFDILFTEEDEDDFDTIVEEYVGAGMFRGGLNELLELAGLDIDAGVRLRMADLLLQENRFNPDPSPEETLGHYFGGVGLSVGKRFIRGADDIREGNIGRGLEQLVPAALTNMYRPFRYAEEGGIRTRRNDIVLADLTTGELITQFLGFPPEEYLRTQEYNRKIKGIDLYLNRKASDLTKKLYVSLQRGDLDKHYEALDEIDEYNDRNPMFAISTARIKRSIKAHTDTTDTKMVNGITLSPNMLKALAEGGSYGGTFSPEV